MSMATFSFEEHNFFLFLEVKSSGRLEFISGIVLHYNQLCMFKIVLLMLF